MNLNGNLGSGPLESPADTVQIASIQNPYAVAFLHRYALTYMVGVLWL